MHKLYRVSSGSVHASPELAIDVDLMYVVHSYTSVAEPTFDISFTLINNGGDLSEGEKEWLRAQASGDDPSALPYRKWNALYLHLTGDQHFSNDDFDEPRSITLADGRVGIIHGVNVDKLGDPNVYIPVGFPDHSRELVNAHTLMSIRATDD